jgi:hypothetical protein
MNISLLNEYEAYGTDNFNGQFERTSEQMNNYDFYHVATYRSSSKKNKENEFTLDLNKNSLWTSVCFDFVPRQSAGDTNFTLNVFLATLNFSTMNLYKNQFVKNN